MCSTIFNCLLLCFIILWLPSVQPHYFTIRLQRIAHMSYITLLENEQEHVCAYCVVQELYSLRISSRINTYSHLNCIDDLSVLCGHIDKYLENRAHTYTHAYEPLVTRSSHKIFIFVPMIQNICK